MGETTKAVHLYLTQSQKMNSHVTWLHKVFCLFRKFSLHMQVKNEDVLTEICTAMLFLVLANLLNVKLQGSKSYKQQKLKSKSTSNHTPLIRPKVLGQKQGENSMYGHYLNVYPYFGLTSEVQLSLCISRYTSAFLFQTQFSVRVSVKYRS